MILDHSKTKKKNFFIFFDINRPDIQYFLEKLKREKEAKLSAQVNDNRPIYR